MVSARTGPKEDGNAKTIVMPSTGNALHETVHWNLTCMYTDSSPVHSNPTCMLKPHLLVSVHKKCSSLAQNLVVSGLSVRDTDHFPPQAVSRHWERDTDDFLPQAVSGYWVRDTDHFPPQVHRWRARCSTCSATWTLTVPPSLLPWSGSPHSAHNHKQQLIKPPHGKHSSFWKKLFMCMKLTPCSIKSELVITRISMVPLVILVGICRAWKKEVFSGPRVVAWAGILTSRGARAPARAGAWTY